MNLRTVALLSFAASGLCLPAMAVAQAQNLIPNGNFTAPDPLQTWRIAFPYEGPYASNAQYVKAVNAPSGSRGKCVVIDLPRGVAGNQGGKIESAFIKAEPGATYKVQVDCMAFDFSAKLHVEAYTTDPNPTPKPDKFRVPAANGMPALVMCYRAQLPDPPAKGRDWRTVERKFTLPEKVTVAGREQAPEWLSIKAVAYAATMESGKSYFSNFRLYKEGR
jgi:hypothetical protein